MEVKSMIIKLGLLVAVGVLGFGCKGGSESAGPSSGSSSSGTTGFASVQPVFQRCVGCHGENGKDGIDMRTYASVMKGGEDGPIVQAGDSASSLMVKALKGEGVTRMPKNQPALPDEEIKKVEAWIQAGAKE